MKVYVGIPFTGILLALFKLYLTEHEREVMRLFNQENIIRILRAPLSG